MIVSALADHLWQSTWFALAACVLAILVRKDAAKVRYWIWFAASLKFVIPFSLLTLLGSQFIVQAHDEHALLPLVQDVVAPLTATIELAPIETNSSRLLIVLWALGSAVILARWLVHWLRARALVANSVPCDSCAGVPLHQSAAILEPCVVGIRRPVLLIPANLATTLSRQQLDAVIAHELWHVRRRDNLTASIHQAIVALFWFHPLVWWIGARLLTTREHACDEGAIEEGRERATYAEALLRVCEHSVQSRLACVARAVGGDLKARIRSIMSQRSMPRWWLVRRTLLATTLVVCAAVPVAAGVTVVSLAKIHVAAGARSIRVADGSGPAFINADGDHVYARNVSLRELIGQSHGIHARDVMGRYEWLDRPRYDIDLRSANGATEPRKLVADLLREQFNIELIERPFVAAQVSTASSLSF
jgi:beta-lactamase regulating signal transducer with metallopeptidase domain